MAGLAGSRAFHLHFDQLAGVPGGAPGPCLVERSRVPEGRDLSGRSEAEPVESARACPVERFPVVRHGGAEGGRDHAVGQVEDLLEPLAPVDGERAGAPEEFQRCLRRMPVPPAGCVAPSAAAEFARHDGPTLANALQHVVEPVLEPCPPPIPPARAQHFSVAPEPQLPIGIERHGDDRRIVGPVLEQRAPPFQQVVEMLRPVASAPGGQNHMVGALDRGDAVDLDEAQTLDQPCKIFTFRRAPKAVPVEEQLPGSPVGEARRFCQVNRVHSEISVIYR